MGASLERELRAAQYREERIHARQRDLRRELSEARRANGVALSPAEVRALLGERSDGVNVVALNAKLRSYLEALEEVAHA